MSKTTAEYITTKGSKNMDYPKAQYARNLAARFWFINNNIKIETIAQEWEISVEDVWDILHSKAYRLEVETLLRTTRSPTNLLKWIESFGDHIPSGLARRMRLSETVFSEMIEKIKGELHNGE